MTFYIITFRVKFLPYSMIAMTMVLKGPDAAFLQGTGLIAAHLYDFLTRVYPAFGGGVNYVSTPRFLTRLFSAGPAGGRAKSHGTAFQARSGSAKAPEPSRGWTSGFGSNTWGNRGPGHRLG